MQHAWHGCPLRFIGYIRGIGVRFERIVKFIAWPVWNSVYILAHSLSNIVVGEALRKAAQDGLGQLVNTYVASQRRSAGKLL